MEMPTVDPVVETKEALPFDGVFRFTNFTDSEFRAKWNSVEYIFPALSTSPLIIPGETPEGVQSIRKKFARELALEVHYKTREYKDREATAPVGSGLTPAVFTENDLAPLIQKCLDPLPLAHAKAEVVEKRPVELKTDSKGRPVTKVVEEGDSLVGEGQVIA